jgi:tetratricopeptide (TPR) repeat protein
MHIQNMLQEISTLISENQDAAKKTIQKIVGEDACNVKAWFQLGVLELHENQFAEAEISFEKAIQLAPDWMEMLLAAAHFFMKKRKYKAAIYFCEKAQQLDKNSLDVLMHLVHCYNKEQKYTEGRHWAKEALKINPSLIDFWVELSFAELGLNLLPEVLDSVEHGLQLNPNQENLLVNGAIACVYLGKNQEAMELNEKALFLNPAHEKALNTKGKLLYDLGKYQEAIEIFQKIIEHHPNQIEIIWNLGIAYLLVSDLQTGFRLYESRLDIQLFSRKYRQIDSLWWQGEPIEGKSLLVRSEQGYGDVIQFARYLPLLAQLNCKIIFEIFSSLHPLFEHLELSLVSPEEPVPKHDLQIKLMSLPFLFKTDLSSMPPPIFIAHTRQVVKNRVGLVWKGRPTHKKDKQRSLPLEALIPLLQIQKIHYVSLQQNITLEEEKWLQFYNIDQPCLDTWSDTVRVLETCELVVCVDTAIAHLAGSMAIPTWILLPFVPDWRWLLNRSDSPWYSSVTLFRQSSLDNWDEPLGKIQKALMQSRQR